MKEFAPDHDIVASTEVAQAMGMHPWEVTSNPEVTSKFNDIADYFAPFSDKGFLIQKLTRGMSKDQAVDHVWKYVGLRREFSQTKEKMDGLTKELERYES